MTNKQINFLRYIKKPKSVSKVLAKYKLEDYRYIYSYLDIFNNAYFSFDSTCTMIYATNRGIEIVENRNRQYVFFWIPVVISIIALISSFKHELLWLLQSIVQLLKLSS